MQDTTSNTLEGIWIDIEILKDQNLSIQEKFMLAVIKVLDKGKGCYASNRYFADLLNVTPKRASDIIRSLIIKEYVVSEIENFYKRTLRMNKKEDAQESQEQQEYQENIQSAKINSKRKSIIWRGIDLSTWTEDALERMKKRFKEVEILLSGGTVDESVQPVFRTNEEIYSTYKEVPSEWIGIKQLAFKEGTDCNKKELVFQ